MIPRIVVMSRVTDEMDEPWYIKRIALYEKISAVITAAEDPGAMASFWKRFCDQEIATMRLLARKVAN